MEPFVRLVENRAQKHHAPRSHTFTPIEGLTQGGSQTILHFRTAGLLRRYGDIDYARLLARDLFSKSGFAGTVAADNNEEKS